MTTDRISIALAQLDCAEGAVTANLDRVRTARAEAAARGADLVLCPEWTASGPPPDGGFAPALLDAVEEGVRALAAETADGGPALLIGAPWRQDGRTHGGLVLLDGGAVATLRFRHHRPEGAPFVAGPVPGPMSVRGVRLGVMAGADLESLDVAETLAESGAEILAVLDAEPFAPGGHDRRVQAAVVRVIECGLPLVRVNPAGGQGRRVFEGASFAIGADRSLRVQATAFEEHLVLTRWERDDDAWICAEGERIAPTEGAEALYRALTLRLAGHANKNGFAGAVVPLNGGLDGALSAALAVDALGAERVRVLLLPGPDSAADRLDDAVETAELLGCRCDRVAIEPALRAFDSMLAPIIAGGDADALDTGLRARVRAVTLATLAEGMAALAVTPADPPPGGFAAFAGVDAAAVRDLVRWRNAHSAPGLRGPAGRVVPARVGG
ncbi:NAD(+) synthase [Azospirillum sp. RWY-5-1]|uniref:Glutamine-dependent NAD(+) synthetase n=1 Tax=Azospirillum oleiclasticum TaxID=2735135 RepID=A0ABX2TF55_9PROT|nr:nitrilase-related carbon-nitrogen hydrolase [Azospirillum oleiclasticum]NYZ15666.1 NAD(+) synthase [Azospirillum oleiclasticum]NYZ21936.1 NAD(+) synthase [Azospirillum oleiclasticum]